MPRYTGFMEEQQGMSRKTVAIGIAVAVFFCGIVLVLIFNFIKQRGGENVAAIVADAIEGQRLTNDAGTLVVADKLLVVFRQSATMEQRQAAAQHAGVRIVGEVVGSRDTYVVSLSQAITARELKSVVGRLAQSPDILEARMIIAE
ncbi:MAG: hypothetical protein Q8Q39_03255 [bacterium]|nr:hypothetical protein [bacterium]